MMVGTLTPIQYTEHRHSRRHLPLARALLLSLAIAGLGWRFGALTGPGVLAASLVGSAVLVGTGWPGLWALGVFFAGSSAISRLAPDRTWDLDAKGGRRDPWQVLANGAAAAVGALVPGAGLWIVTASLAAAAADTWATATGGWSRALPRHIVTGCPVPAGTSGGVTLIGSAGALVGAAGVGLAAAVAGRRWALFALALGVGMLGMLADSVIGALVQGRFHCDSCGLATERRVHRCGRPARPVGGLSWLSNDAVNALATLGAAAAGFAAWHRWGT